MRRRTTSWGFIAGLAMCCVLGSVALAAAAAPEASAYVAEWQGGGVTVGDFISWWRFSTEANRPELKTLDERLAFLEPIINGQLMLEQAESLGIDLLPTVTDFARGRRVATLVEAVQVRATEGRIKVDSLQLEDIYNKRLTEMEIKQIVVRTQDEARAMWDSLAAGASFEDLAQRYSISPTGEYGGSVGKVKWRDFSDRWSSRAYALEPGQFCEPFQVEGGWCILKSYSKTLIEPGDPAAERAGIRAILERDAIMKERGAYLDSLKAAYGYNLDLNAVINLSTKYALAIARLGEPTAVVEAELEPDVSAAERAVPLVTMRGKTLTTGAMMDIIARTPFQVRPRVDDPDDFIPFILKQANDSLLVAEAEKLGLEKDPEIAAMVNKAKRRKTLLAFYEFVARDAAVSEQEARDFYQANAQYYNMPNGYMVSKIVVGTKEAADSVITRVQAGEDFAEIARVRSRDPFSAPQGGDMGFLKVGEDEEFDGFLATMEPGQRKAFRSLEGFVVLWLRERQVGRPATFEEARGAIEIRLLPIKKDAILEKWITDRRAALGVRVNEDVLKQVVLPT
jgi:parvulin-like peptidyl-prolyl isomerase